MVNVIFAFMNDAIRGLNWAQSGVIIPSKICANLAQKMLKTPVWVRLGKSSNYLWLTRDKHVLTTC